MIEQNKVVAIAGAAGALGPTVARAFAQTGASLALAGRRQTELEQLLDALDLPPSRRLASAVDLTDFAATKTWAHEIINKFGRVDVVLHLVGGYKSHDGIAEIRDDDWQFIHSLLVMTTLNMARAFANPLKANGGGRFIFISSPVAQTPTAPNAIYAMGKAAGEALTLALANEYRGNGRYGQYGRRQRHRDARTTSAGAR